MCITILATDITVYRPQGQCVSAVSSDLSNALFYTEKCQYSDVGAVLLEFFRKIKQT
jgi:hypothetical protein